MVCSPATNRGGLRSPSTKRVGPSDSRATSPRISRTSPVQLTVGARIEQGVEAENLEQVESVSHVRSVMASFVPSAQS